MTVGKRPSRIPGEDSFWVLLGGDLMVFALLFATFMYYRLDNVVLYERSAALTSQSLGLINTMILLTGSLLVALGVARVRQGLASWQFLYAGAASGVIFALIKCFEYAVKIEADITVTTNIFFTLYFAFTGIHLIHVLIGTGLLYWLGSGLREGRQHSSLLIENIALFWHLVDLLWLILFTLFYLI